MEAVQDLVSQHIDKVEAQFDSTVDGAKEAVHKLRGQEVRRKKQLTEH